MTRVVLSYFLEIKETLLENQMWPSLVDPVWASTALHELLNSLKWNIQFKNNNFRAITCPEMNTQG